MEISVLTANRLFHDLPPEVVGRAVQLLEEAFLEAGTIIFESGDSAAEMYLILSGIVRISRENVTLTHLDAGQFFGEMALVQLAPRSARATAITQVHLAKLSANALGELLKLAPLEVASNLTRTAMERIRAANEVRVENVLRAERLSLVGKMAGEIVHDLKNPLSVVLGAAEMLEEKIGSPDKLSGMLRRSVSRMQGMVQDILDYARGTWALDLRSVRVDDLVSDLNEQVLDRLERNGIQVNRVVNYSAVIEADAGTLLRALANICKNAGEAMSGSGTLTFSTERRGDEAIFTIADTGKGIEEARLPTIFEPFVTHGKSDGTGLGMATTKGIIEAHGGSISVQSTVGEGTIFEIVIPVGLHSPPSVSEPLL